MAWEMRETSSVLQASTSHVHGRPGRAEGAEAAVVDVEAVEVTAGASEDSCICAIEVLSSRGLGIILGIILRP